MKTKEIQELYQIKLHSMDTILHQISLMDRKRKILLRYS